MKKLLFDKELSHYGLVVVICVALFGCSVASEPENSSATSTPETKSTVASTEPAEVTSAQPSAETATEPAAKQDKGYGSLTGQIVVKGKPPERPPLNLGDHKDKGLCLVDGKPPLDETIVVDENGGLRDAYILMYIGRGEEEPTPHPSYAEMKDKSLTIDNEKCLFVPHALFVRTGQNVNLKNSDPVGHNCHIVTFNNEENINLPPNGNIDIKFSEEDKIPGEVKCDVHPWMHGVIMIRDNPYVAITSADGKFEIKNIPAGNWKFQFWHKNIGFLKTLEVPGKELGRRGEAEFEIKDGEAVDLGKLSLPTESFK